MSVDRPDSHGAEHMFQENDTSVYDQLRGHEVLTTDGVPVRFGDVLRERTTLVAFVRHFG